MTRVDFYVLGDLNADARQRFACRLAHMAWSAGQTTHVRTASDEASALLDELMWHHPEGRFLPHALAEAADSAQAPVRIGAGEPEPDADQLLINLGDDVPTFFARFERVAEVVTQPQRELGRQRYRHYRERGYPLFHHQDSFDWERR